MSDLTDEPKRINTSKSTLKCLDKVELIGLAKHLKIDKLASLSTLSKDMLIDYILDPPKATIKKIKVTEEKKQKEIIKKMTKEKRVKVTNPWNLALKEWNLTTKTFGIPKKDTDEYKQVKEISNRIAQELKQKKCDVIEEVIKPNSVVVEKIKEKTEVVKNELAKPRTYKKKKDAQLDELPKKEIEN